MGKKAALIALALALVMLLGACGASFREGSSPSLLSAVSWGENDGTDDGQYLIAQLTFDRAVAVKDGAAKQLRVTVGGNRVSEDDIALTAQGDVLELKLHVTVSTSGELVVTAAKSGNSITAVTDSTGKYAVGTLNVDVYVPSGVTLAETGASGSSATYRIASLWTHRSIFWLQVLINGQVQQPDAADVSEVLSSGAVAIHGHNFRTDDETAVAANMAQVLNARFGNELTAEADGGQVTVTLKNAGSGDTVALAEYLG